MESIEDDLKRKGKFELNLSENSNDLFKTRYQRRNTKKNINEMNETYSVASKNQQTRTDRIAAHLKLNFKI